MTNDRVEETRKELARRELARRDLIAFAWYTYRRYQAAGVHRLLAEYLEEVERFVASGGEEGIGRLMVFMPPRHGKLLADHTLVPTACGWKLHCDLVPGDQVFGLDGGLVNVLAISQPGLADVRIEMSDGSAFLCHENHEWVIYNRSMRKWQTIETSFLMRETKFGERVQLKSAGRYIYQLPNIEALQYPTAELPLHPYVLGAWLGDGSSTKPCITHDPNEHSVIEEIERQGYDISTVCTHNETGVLTTYFGGPRPGVAGRMTRELQALGVWGNKHIPECYKRSNVEQRLELIAGLVDTDGHVGKRSRVRIVTADPVLCNDIVEILASLGFRPYVCEQDPTTSTSGIVGTKTVYYIGFQPTMQIPTRLERKEIRRLAKQRRVSIVAVERVEPETGRCVQVDSKDGIYLVGRNFIPTHNSELVSKRFPAWFLGRNPDKRVILSSCTGSLAYDFSRGVREIVKDTPFQAVFGARSSQQEPVLLSTESRAVDAWNIEGHRGGLVAAGVGGSIIGRGADLAVIDDPFKDRNDAESQATRDKVDAWYRSTLYTRLEEAGAIVLMHQRWHSDDLAGRLIRRMLEGGDRWEILSLPALAEAWAQEAEGEQGSRGAGEQDFEEMVRKAVRQGYWISRDPLGREPGEALWAGKFDREALDAIRANLGGYDWDALYQQRPRQLEGALIKANEIPIVDQAPQGLRLARYWDLAVSGRESADYIVGAKVGRSSEGRLYILDIARFPGPWADARPRMVATMQRDGARVEQGIEVSGQQGGYFQELQRDDALAGVPIKGVDPRKVGNKEVRANVWASRIEDGLVAMVRAPWNDDFVAEALSFPRGQHDDQVDAVSGAVQMLPAMVSFSDVPQAPDVRSRWDAFGAVTDMGFWEMTQELSGHPSKGLG